MFYLSVMVGGVQRNLGLNFEYKNHYHILVLICLIKRNSSHVVVDGRKTLPNYDKSYTLFIHLCYFSFQKIGLVVIVCIES